MANIIEITDLTAPELAVYTQLTQAQLRSRVAPERALFIAESPKVIGTALDAGCQPVSFLMEREKITGQASALLDRCGDVPVYTADRACLAALTGYTLTRGVLCAMRRPVQPPLSQLLPGTKRLAVLESIVDSTNLGAIFRCAAALGIDAVLLTADCCDPLCRRAVRVSMGTVFQLPWAYLPREGWLSQLQAAGFYCAAMALTPDARPMDDPALPSHDRLAIVLGTEGTGLRPATIAACDCAVQIPMAHGVDSLNVAAASAVAFWQLRPRL